jgi:hypothetical protein
LISKISPEKEGPADSKEPAGQNFTGRFGQIRVAELGTENRQLRDDSEGTGGAFERAKIKPINSSRTKPNLPSKSKRTAKLFINPAQSCVKLYGRIVTCQEYY